MNNNNLTITLADGPSVPSTRNKIIFPIVFTPPADPVADFVRLLTGDHRQERQRLEVCPTLTQAALWRAHGLANGQPWSHTDNAGGSPNERVRAAGCKLPDSYGIKANNVESLGAGTNIAGIIYAALTGSAKHGPHLLGQGWFRHQTCVGVAMAENQESEFKWYWCVLIASCSD